jgi:phospholipid transport system substrate-binding protein
MLHSLPRPALLLAALVALPALANEDVLKPVKTVVQSVRYGKDDLAVKQFATDAQGAYLVGEEAWKSATDAQRDEFKALFSELFSKLAFPKVRENFKNLASITYDAPKVDGDKATVGSVILINHPLKKQELKLNYSLVKDGKAWRVVDVKVLGDSMLEGIRDDQVKPIMAEGGWNSLLSLMRAKSAELKKARSK